MSSGNELKVVAGDLRNRAGIIEGTAWPHVPSAQTQAPCELPLAKVASFNLALNYFSLASYQIAGQAEGDRLTHTLKNVATAYETLDQNAKDAIARGSGAAPEPVAVQPFVSEPAPPAFPVPNLFPLDPGGGDVESTQQLLRAGDQGASLADAAQFLETQSTALEAKAREFTVLPLDWDGDAAEAADTRFGAFQAWLLDLSQTQTDLAGEARKVLAAHQEAVTAHQHIYDDYIAVKKLAFEEYAAGTLTPARLVEIENRLQELNAASEDVRKTYASRAATEKCQPAEVPTGTIGAASVSTREKPLPTDQPGAPGQDDPGTSPGRSPGATPAGSSPGAGTPPTSTPETTQTAPPGAGGTPQESGSGAGSGGGSPSGGSPSGGSPSGGSPSSSPMGLPEGTGAEIPSLPTDDPSLHPAAADAGGGSGGSGGGLSPVPLSPNVGGVAVGPGPAGGATAGAPAAPSAAGSGMAGMGGGMPMGGAGHGQGGAKEKKRAPGTAPDEDLYTEDRPWTEPVIGNQRRRTIQDTKDSK